VRYLNIGTAGHVDHGKTSLVSKLTGKWTDTHSEEKKRGITIRLGYANASIYRCSKCPEESYTLMKKCIKHESDCEEKVNVSFVDAPGHETLMTVMIAGTSMMDGVLFVIAANEKCPQPQTKEHLMALDIAGIKNIIIVQNKIDLVTEEKAKENYNQIKELIKGTTAENAVIIPVSTQFGANIDILLQAIVEVFKEKEKNEKSQPIYLIARSFDINKPGGEPSKLKGGVLGGVLKQGTLKKGDNIIILPDEIKTKISSIDFMDKIVDKITPGGTTGICTSLDPSLTKADRLSGSIITLEKEPLPIRNSLSLEFHLMERIVGTEEEVSAEPIRINEKLVINAWTSKTIGTVLSVKKNILEVKLSSPICILDKEKVTLSRMINNRWRLVGYGIIK